MRRNCRSEKTSVWILAAVTAADAVAKVATAVDVAVQATAMVVRAAKVAATIAGNSI
jgi:hypothetical protein